jgi:hypothetical protein
MVVVSQVSFLQHKSLDYIIIHKDTQDTTYLKFP